MLRQRVECVASGDETLVRLVAATLRGHFPEHRVSNADARRVVMGRAVLVNGHPSTRPGVVLQRGDRVSIAADLKRLSSARVAHTEPIPILFQDTHLVAVNKPAGLATHATADANRPHLVGLLAKQLGVAPSAIGIHQRLDAGTSGLVLFGLTSVANRGLAEAFAGRSVGKVYLAIVDAGGSDVEAGAAWTSRGALVAAGGGRRGRHVAVGDEGQMAETAFVVRRREGRRLLIEAKPKTGRRHQIRAHLAAARLPILGDDRYGGAPAGRLHLHAWRLSLAHPVTGASLTIEAAPPEGWL